MRRSDRDGRLVGWLCLALLVGACFGGGFAVGLPCESDEECGPELTCVEGFCGGLGDPALCGNGLHDVGEECDDGNDEEGDECTPQCRLPVCGDGFVGPSEECDDGNAVERDGCSTECRVVDVCGDGVTDPGEECDDGNTLDGDACAADCRLSIVCGNGLIQLGEECDDGNTMEADFCTPACSLPLCGDGYIGPGEACDDGNDVETDACTMVCALPACGDGIASESEVCDDSNDVETDDCTTSCMSSPEVPTLELSLAQVKRFVFTWEPVRGAEYYELLERVDEGEAFEVVAGGIVGESFTLAVPLLQRLHASYALRACNSVRCSESIAVDVVGNLAEAVGYFKASNTDLGDGFGVSVALSADGNTLAVGAFKERSSATGIDGDQDDDSLFQPGAVYVFVREGNDWSQQAYVKASNTGWIDHFGASVALSADGNTLAVGAVDEDSSATGIDGNQDDDSAVQAGAVYVFVRSGDAWSQQAYVKASNTSAFDHFGGSVALSADGNTLAVGASGEGWMFVIDDDDSSYAGAVYVFVRSGDAWSDPVYVKASNVGNYDYFGGSVALSADGSTLAVGAVGEDSSAMGIDGDQGDGSMTDAGAVYVFVRDGMDQWPQQAYVKASNTGPDDRFGASVALSADGHTLAVGAFGEDSSATGIDGNQDDASASNAGAAYVFVRDGVAWSQQGYVKASNTDEGDRFGGSVALSADGHTLGVGAVAEDSTATGIDDEENDDSALNSGAVYLFVHDGGAWSQQAYVKAPKVGVDDDFGRNVALSADGLVLAVGAPQENYGETGIGAVPMTAAFNSGAVYLY